MTSALIGPVCSLRSKHISIGLRISLSCDRTNKNNPGRVAFGAGGEREIRTPEEVSPLTVFKTVPFNRSGISPTFIYFVKYCNKLFAR